MTMDAALDQQALYAELARREAGGEVGQA